MTAFERACLPEQKKTRRLDSRRCRLKACSTHCTKHMSATKKKWIIVIGLVLLIAGDSLVEISLSFATRFEPYLREQAVECLLNRLDSDVEHAGLKLGLA